MKNAVGTKITISTKNWEDKFSNKRQAQECKRMINNKEVWFTNDEKTEFCSNYDHKNAYIPVIVTGYYLGRIFCQVVDDPNN